MSSQPWRWLRRPLSRFGSRRWMADASSLLGEDSSQHWVSLLRNLGATPQGQLKALQMVDSQQVLEQKQFQRLLDDVAGQLPRDVGEKATWEATSELAAVLKKLNVQSLHQRLGARMNNALLQDSDLQIRELMEKFSGHVADDYAFWLLNRKLENLLDTLNFEELVSFLHLLAPFDRASVTASGPAVLQRVRHLALGSGGAPSPTAWAKLLQIYDQEASAIQAWEILDALAQQKVNITTWSLPEAAVLASALERHGLPKHSQLAEALLKTTLPKISEDSDVELNLLCISGSFRLHKPTDELAQKCFAALALLAPRASPSEALKMHSLQLRLICWGLPSDTLVLPKNWKDATFPPALVADLVPLFASAGASYTGNTDAVESGPSVVASLSSFRPLLTRLDAEATAVAKRLETKDFCSVALALARLGLGSQFLAAGDLEARLAGSPLESSNLASLLWAMAALEASPVAWALVPFHLKHLEGQEVKLEDKALLYEALSSETVFNPDAFADSEAWKSWRGVWSTVAHIPRSQRSASLQSLLPYLASDSEQCEEDAQIGTSPWKAPLLFVQKKIILDCLPTARHPASGRTRGDLMLKHNTWAETGHHVLVLPDTEWPDIPEVEGSSGEVTELTEGQRTLLKWIKDKVKKLQQQAYLQMHSGIDEKVRKVLMDLELGPRGINSDGLSRLEQLPPNSQMRAVEKYQSSLKDYVKNPSAWFIGILKEEEKPLQEAASKSAEDTALVGKPKDGWKRDGRPLSEVRVGELLMGKVTNMWKGRVWVDIGLEKDGSFLYDGDLNKLQVGTVFQNLKVSRVDKLRNWVELESSRRSKRPVPDSPPVPLARKRKGGWLHKDGILLAEFQVGATVSGKVTNVLRDRVWVDVGAEVDATFKKEPTQTFKVGDAVFGEVTFIDLSKEKKTMRIKPRESA